MTAETFTPEQESFLSGLEVQIQRGLEEEMIADFDRRVLDHLAQVQVLLDEAPPLSEMNPEERAMMQQLMAQHELLLVRLTEHYDFEMENVDHGPT